MLNKNQEQEVSHDSIAAQGGRDVNIQVTNIGLNYSDVKAIAKDEALIVFRENFPKLQGEAKKLATERGEKITEDFFVKLQNENPEGIYQANTPDFQDALFTVQKEYAKAGDEELGLLLVDLLVDRTKETTRSTMQIVLNESLKIAPKLTTNHLAVLAIIFFFGYSGNKAVGDIKLLNEHFSKYIKDFICLLPSNVSAFQHLQFAGCGSITMANSPLEGVLKITYCGLFNNGFDENQFKHIGITLPLNDENFFIPCLNNRSKYQVRGVEIISLKEYLVAKGVTNDNQDKMMQLFQSNMMSDDEVRNKIVLENLFMEELFNIWNSTNLSRFQLTSVGIAIGHAYIKKYSGDFGDLSNWIS